jgi:hypothetical protein
MSRFICLLVASLLFSFPYQKDQRRRTDSTVSVQTQNTNFSGAQWNCRPQSEIKDIPFIIAGRLNFTSISDPF